MTQPINRLTKEENERIIRETIRRMQGLLPGLVTGIVAGGGLGGALAPNYVIVHDGAGFGFVYLKDGRRVIVRG